ncbi:MULTISPECIES: ABC transporter ATP-binding protein [Gordonibacter]|uniref:ABC transporter ATP-binding protein n=1 Tax=Gordonibacter faecis TaxID=3047475 RepID=A0ABT7DIN4_9ACTN|nr:MULTISPECIES: ABC transporter ATP-binding protein [unclassified Gordonibacter]MDJ1649390.1 ABC transporter ATP-binding protein [Gordonibacter sp. KGMB12511]HIW75143.1 ABC transporter ATP-binding protein/permease [Candidatus Gordonibacter avicola]
MSNESSAAAAPLAGDAVAPISTEVWRDVGKEAKPRNAILRLLDFAGPRRKLAVIGCILSAVNAVVALMPLVFVWFVVRDLVAVAPNWSEAADVTQWGWWACVFAAAALFIYLGALMCTHLAAFRTAANMRRAALKHLGRVPLGYFDSHASGQVRRIVDGCAAQTEDVLAHKLPDFVGSLVTPVAFLAVMLVFDWVLGLVCLIPIAVSFFALWWMIGRQTKRDGMTFMVRYQDALNRMNKAAVEYVRGIPVVKVFQQTVHSFKAFSEAIMSYRDMAGSYARSCQKPQVIQLVAINATFAVLVPAGILLAHSAGDFATFLTDFLFYVVFSALTTIMMSKVMYAAEAVQMAQDSVRRIDEVLSVELLAEPPVDCGLMPRDASISFERVGFTYPGADGPALSGVSLEVPTGATVALVGPSGGGKTTAASLVPRFWDACEGVVRVGGVDVRDIPTSELMAQVAFVFQNDRLFKRSLADNIRAACPSATRAQVEAAAHAAQCDDIVSKFPAGLDTVVGAKGVYLSGGECQRIALARAILKDAPIVVLDEATAFADPENEALIQAALAELTKGKTVLMIAHRLSTVVHADAIHVLEGGHLVESGTHDELAAAGGLYAKMWDDYRTSVSWKIERGESHAA